MEEGQIIKLKKPNGRKHSVKVSYHDLCQGSIVYLIHYIDTDTFYVGSTSNVGDRIQSHFTHPATYTYEEALKNNTIHVKVIKKCESYDEALYREGIVRKSAKKIYGDKLINKKI